MLSISSSSETNSMTYTPQSCQYDTRYETFDRIGTPLPNVRGVESWIPTPVPMYMKRNIPSMSRLDEYIINNGQFCRDDSMPIYNFEDTCLLSSPDKNNVEIIDSYCIDDSYEECYVYPLCVEDTEDIEQSTNIIQPNTFLSQTNELAEQLRDHLCDCYDHVMMYIECHNDTEINIESFRLQFENDIRVITDWLNKVVYEEYFKLLPNNEVTDISPYEHCKIHEAYVDVLTELDHACQIIIQDKMVISISHIIPKMAMCDDCDDHF